MRRIDILEHGDDYKSYYAFVDQSEEDLEHHGVFGMRWGIRKYQNKDGSLTPAGRIHYGVGQRSNEEVIDRVARDRASNHKRTKNATIWTLLGGPGAGALAAILTKTSGKGYEKLVQEYKDDDEFQNLKKTLENLSDVPVSEIINNKEKYPYEGYEDAPKNAKERAEAESVDGYSFEEESKKYGLKSDRYYEEKFEREYKADPKKYDKWFNEYGAKKEDLIKEFKVFDQTLQELDPKQKLHDTRSFIAEGYKKDKTFWEYNGKIYANIYDIVYEKMEGVDRSYGKVGGDLHKKFQRIDALKKSGLTLKEVANKLNMPEGTVASYYYMFG